MTVGENAATADTTELRVLTTTTALGSVEVYNYNNGSPNSQGGTQVQNGGFDGNNHQHQVRFAIPVSSTTFALDGVVDAAQAVILQAQVEVTYTTAGAHGDSPMLQALGAGQHAQSRRVRLANAANRQLSPSAQFVLQPSDSGAASSASSSNAGLAMSTMVVVVAVGAVLVLLVAYRAGLRSGDSDSAGSTDGDMVQLRKSSSTVELQVHAEES